MRGSPDEYNETTSEYQMLEIVMLEKDVGITL